MTVGIAVWFFLFKSFRLALGETQIVEDTKRFLEEEGIHLQVAIFSLFICVRIEHL
jgi:hypothetical protein